MPRILYLLCLLLFAIPVLAGCPHAQRELEVPAITETGRAELVRIGVETRPGSDEVFISAKPAIGYYTQLSEQTARDVAFRMTNTSGCDVYLRIFAPAEISHVDGPSGGAAMTLLILAALRGEQLRPDFSITGTIEGDGAIGPVGGAIAKAEATARAGRTLFLVPRTSYEEKLGLFVIGKIYKIAIGEVDRIERAHAIAVRSAEAEGITFEEEKPIGYERAKINHSNASYFAKIAQRMVEEVREAVNMAHELREHFLSRVNNVEKALEAGRLYTAANGAFLLKIDIAYVNFSDANYLEHKRRTKECIESYAPELTHENFELNSAADLRWIWAKEKIKELEKAETNISVVAQKINLYRELLTARYWCEAAHEMKVNGGRKIDEEALTKIKNFALEIVNNASALLGEKENEYAASHLRTAMAAFDEGLYGAAIIDAAYAMSVLREEVLEIPPQNYTLLWPQLYADHAATVEDTTAAMRLNALARDIENAFLVTKTILEEETKRRERVEIVTNVSEVPEIQNITVNVTNITGNITNITITKEKPISMFEAGAIIALSIIILVLILKR